MSPSPEGYYPRKSGERGRLKSVGIKSTPIPFGGSERRGVCVEGGGKRRNSAKPEFCHIGRKMAAVLMPGRGNSIQKSSSRGGLKLVEIGKLTRGGRENSFHRRREIRVIEVALGSKGDVGMERVSSREGRERFSVGQGGGEKKPALAMEEGFSNLEQRCDELGRVHWGPLGGELAERPKRKGGLYLREGVVSQSGLIMNSTIYQSVEKRGEPSL